MKPTHDKKHRFVRDSKVGFFSEIGYLVEKIRYVEKRLDEIEDLRNLGFSPFEAFFSREVRKVRSQNAQSNIREVRHCLSAGQAGLFLIFSLRESIPRSILNLKSPKMELFKYYTIKYIRELKIDF